MKDDIDQEMPPGAPKTWYEWPFPPAATLHVTGGPSGVWATVGAETAERVDSAKIVTARDFMGFLLHRGSGRARPRACIRSPRSALLGVCDPRSCPKSVGTPRLGRFEAPLRADRPDSVAFRARSGGQRIYSLGGGSGSLEG